MARKVDQIIARGECRWLIRVYLGRDHGRHLWGNLLYKSKGVVFQEFPFNPCHKPVRPSGFAASVPDVEHDAEVEAGAEAQP